MKKICIDVNYFENEEHIMKCPFCDQIIQNDEISNNGTELKINECPHTLFWAIDGSIEFQTPFFDDILVNNTDSNFTEEDDELNREENGELLFFDGSYLDLEKNDNIIVYEISDCSPGAFQTFTIFHFGFINDEVK